MKKRIIGKRLHHLLTQKKYSIKAFADLAYLSRTTISQLCNDNYEKPLYENTTMKIRDALRSLGYGPDVMDYLYGEIEYNDMDLFSADSSPARAYRATEKISDILAEMEYSAILDDRRHMRVYGKDKTKDYLDMDASEYSKFKFFLLEQIKAACDNYVHVCYRHDEELSHKHEIRNVSEHFDPVDDLHYYPDK